MPIYCMTSYTIYLPQTSGLGFMNEATYSFLLLPGITQYYHSVQIHNLFCPEGMG
jgi:hypothetical protein